jgi:hypothetical protein
VQHEIVRAAGDIDRVELDRPEPAASAETFTYLARS